MMLLVTDNDIENGELIDASNDSGVAGTIERRRGLRIAQARPVKVFEHTASRYFGGQTCDISATGLRLELPASAALRPGRVLSVHVGLGASGSCLANRRQMMPARVVWMDRSRSDGKLTAGVEFLASIAAHLDAA